MDKHVYFALSVLSIFNYLERTFLELLNSGWFSLGVGDWMKLIPFGVAVGGLSYLSLQVGLLRLGLISFYFISVPSGRILTVGVNFIYLSYLSLQVGLFRLELISFYFHIFPFR